jgi:hypothetical protein
LRVLRSRALDAFIETKDQGLFEVVVEDAIVEAVADLFPTITELISTPSFEP